MNNITDKLMAQGAESLSGGELLSLIVEDETMGEALLAECGNSLARLAGMELPRLRMMQGLGLRRAQRLAACAELGRRVAEETAWKAEFIITSDDVAELFRPMLKQLHHEECWALFLTSSNRIIGRLQVSRGGVQGTVVDHRLIVKKAIELLATQMILVHNHPSGAAEPSPQDISLTEKIAEAATLFDIRLLDHVIVAREGCFSFRQEGLIK